MPLAFRDDAPKLDVILTGDCSRHNPQEARQEDEPYGRQGSGVSGMSTHDDRYKRQGSNVSGVSSLRQRASTAGLSELNDLDTEPFETQPSPTREWSEDHFGTMLHKPTGLRVSPEKGIQVDGVDYRLSPEDVEISDGAILGCGASGVVREGRLKSSGLQVAIKTLKVGADKVKREQMLKEIRGLVQAEGCPYLIQWYSGYVDRATGSVHVVVELLNQGSLADLRKRHSGRAIPARHVACIAAQVVKGLRFLQVRDVLHRDVKPENILHTSEGKVKLTDFGISKEMHLADVSSTFVGTATYMAPERAAGDNYSFESDIWSAGMVFYELAAGRYPFCTSSFPELFVALCEGPEPRLEASTHPPALRDLVARCLIREPAKRPDAAALQSHELVAGLVQSHLASFAAWLAEQKR